MPNKATTRKSMAMQVCLRHLQRLAIAVAVVSLAGVATADDDEGKVATFAGKDDSYIAIDHDKLCVDDATLEVWVHPTSVQGWRVSDSPQRQTNCAGSSECYHAVLTFTHWHSHLHAHAHAYRIYIYIYMHMHMHIAFTFTFTCTCTCILLCTCT